MASTDSSATGAAKARISPGSRAQVGVANHLALRGIARAAGGWPPPNVFGTLARHRRLFRTWLPFGLTLLRRGTLAQTDTELLILRVAHNCQCGYERHHHEAIALDAGLSPEQIAATREAPGAGCFSERETMLLRAADELHEEREISAPLWAQLARALSEEELIEVCMLVGHYEMLAMTLNSLGVKPEEAAETRTLQGAPARFPAGLVDTGSGVHVWQQPNGETGESNAGLIVGEGASVLIDTLWDLRLTRRLLAAAEGVTEGAPIAVLVNTHGDGDHCWGNQLLQGAEIISSTATAEDMMEEDPRALRLMVAAGSAAKSLAGTPMAAPFRSLAAFGALTQQLRPYDFRGIELTPPTRTFEETLTLDVGGRRIELEYLGPAHTPGDTIVHVPDASTVFAGDFLFAGVAPIMWTGTVDNWIAALDRILALEPATIVPGHGPVGGIEIVREMRAYWEHVLPAVRQQLAAGLPPAEAAARVLASERFAEESFAGWDGHERLAVTAHTIARNDRGEVGRPGMRERTRALIELAQLAAARAGQNS